MINAQKVIEKEYPIERADWDGWLRDTPYCLYQTFRVPQLTNIDEYKKVDIFYSQLGQDLWVARYLKGKSKGFYIDIGCYDPVHENNTYYFERNLGWEGLSITPHDWLKKEWQGVRDVTSLIVDTGIPLPKDKSIDYLSISNTESSLEIIEAVKDLEIKCITIRHDGYNDSGELMQKQREILSESYTLELAGNTNGDGHNDFWVNETTQSKQLND